MLPHPAGKLPANPWNSRKGSANYMFAVPEVGARPAETRPAPKKRSGGSGQRGISVLRVLNLAHIQQETNS